MIVTLTMFALCVPLPEPGAPRTNITVGLAAMATTEELALPTCQVHTNIELVIYLETKQWMLLCCWQIHRLLDSEITNPGAI